MPIRDRRPLLVAMLVLALPGCGGSARDQELDTVRSWTATMRLAAQQRARGAVPARYAAQLRDRAAEALADAERSLATDDSTAAQRHASRGALDSLRASIRDLPGDAQ